MEFSSDKLKQLVNVFALKKEIKNWKPKRWGYVKIVYLMLVSFNLLGLQSTAYNVPVFGVILVRIFPTFSRIRTEYGEIRSI